MRIIQIPILLFQPSIQSSRTSEIGDSTRGRYARSGEDENLLCVFDEGDGVGWGVVLREFGAVTESVSVVGSAGGGRGTGRIEGGNKHSEACDL